MLWALLAAFLRARPPWMQVGMVGLCTGLFVVANVNAGQRDLRVSSASLLVLAVTTPTGWACSVALRGQFRACEAGRPRTARVHAAQAVVWLVSLAAAVGTLLGDGGVKVAVIAIVPIVLLAPPALAGIRALLGRRASRDHAVPPGSG
jgi:hypothetical protein